MEQKLETRNPDYEKKVQRFVLYFFIAVMVFATLGFYPTYLRHFPTFKEFNWVHHFHGLVSSLWIAMLIAQALLIRLKKYSWHRLVGKASYVVMPLLLVSFFLVARTTYFKNIKLMPEPEALAKMNSGIPDIVFMGTFYTLAMVYRKRTDWHLRFFAATGFMTLGPGIGRFAFTTFSPPVAVPILLVSLSLPLIWLIIDIVKKKSPIPLGIYMVIFSCTILNNGKSDWWQATAGWIAANLF